MDSSLLALLPNLSIGVISVLALAYLSLRHGEAQKSSQDVFIRTLDARADKHALAMEAREASMRDLETSVRNNLVEQISRNTVALIDTTKVLERVVRKLDMKS